MLNKARLALRRSTALVAKTATFTAASAAGGGSLGAATLKSVGLWLGGWAVVTGVFALVCVGAASQAFPGDASGSGKTSTSATSAGSAPKPAQAPVTPASVPGARAGGRT